MILKSRAWSATASFLFNRLNAPDVSSDVDVFGEGKREYEDRGGRRTKRSETCKTNRDADRGVEIPGVISTDTNRPRDCSGIRNLNLELKLTRREFRANPRACRTNSNRVLSDCHSHSDLPNSSLEFFQTRERVNSLEIRRQWSNVSKEKKERERESVCVRTWGEGRDKQQQQSDLHGGVCRLIDQAAVSVSDSRNTPDVSVRVAFSDWPRAALWAPLRVFCPDPRGGGRWRWFTG